MRRAAFDVLTLAGALILMSACIAEAQRDASGTIVEGGEISVFSIRVGDCFNDTPEPLDGVMGGLSGLLSLFGVATDSPVSDDVDSLPAVPCAQPHDNEVYAAFDIAAGSDVFPGDALLSEAGESCYDLFEDFVGIPWEDSLLDFFPITPSRQGWEDGDREVVCVLYDYTLAKLTGTMRGSRS